MTKVNGLVLVSMPIKEFNGRLNFGFKISGEDMFFNAYGTQEALELLKEKYVKKGNIIEFENSIEGAKDFVLIKEGKEEEKSGEGFAEDIVPFETLLDEAHKKADKEKLSLNIETQMLSVDLEKQNSVFKAKVTIKNSEGKELNVFEGHGDADQKNISGAFVKPHFIRMAETRAIARALRWYTNISSCSDVETEEGTLPENNPIKQSRRKK